MLLRGLRILVTVTLAVTVVPAWAHAPRTTTPRIDRLDTVVAPTASAPPPDVVPMTPPSEPAVARPPELGAQARVVESLAVLIVALGLAGLARSWRRDRRVALASATAGLLLGFVVETTPHLVHHSLDTDQGADCQAFQAAERSHAAVGAPDGVPAAAGAALDEPPSFVTGPTLSTPAPCGRAPPA